MGMFKVLQYFPHMSQVFSFFGGEMLHMDVTYTKNLLQDQIHTIRSFKCIMRLRDAADNVHIFSLFNLALAQLLL
jgi:hypothetical protein